MFHVVIGSWDWWNLWIPRYKSEFLGIEVDPLLKFIIRMIDNQVDSLVNIFLILIKFNKFKVEIRFLVHSTG